jgi:hypothetical protein
MDAEPVGALPLSVVIGTNKAPPSVEDVVRQFVDQVRDVGGEIIVAASYPNGLPDVHEVRWINVPDERDLFRLRAEAMRVARGSVIAIGEDHSVPRPGWCEAVLRSHREHPDADAIAGCLVNATPKRVTASASFLTYASPFTPPMPELPADRPPPVSVISVKRRALAGLGDVPDTLEARLLPELFAEGRIAADDRIVADHYQDFDFVEAVKNQFWVNRAAYGYSLLGAERARRATVARWVITHVPQQFWREASPGVPPGPRRWLELALIAVFSATAGLGGVVGALFGPGDASELMA